MRYRLTCCLLLCAAAPLLASCSSSQTPSQAPGPSLSASPSAPPVLSDTISGPIPAERSWQMTGMDELPLELPPLPSGLKQTPAVLSEAHYPDGSTLAPLSVAAIDREDYPQMCERAAAWAKQALALQSVASSPGAYVLDQSKSVKDLADGCVQSLQAAGEWPIAALRSASLEGGTWMANIRVVTAGADEMERYSVTPGGYAVSTKLGMPYPGLRIDFFPAASPAGAPAARLNEPEIVEASRAPSLDANGSSSSPSAATGLPSSAGPSASPEQ